MTKKVSSQTIAETISLKSVARDLGKDLGLLSILTIGKAVVKTRRAAEKARRVAAAAAKAAAEEAKKQQGDG